MDHKAWRLRHGCVGVCQIYFFVGVNRFLPLTGMASLFSNRFAFQAEAALATARASTDAEVENSAARLKAAMDERDRLLEQASTYVNYLQLARLALAHDVGKTGDYYSAAAAPYVVRAEAERCCSG